MPTDSANSAPVPAARVQQRIVVLRGQCVIFAAGLAATNGSSTKRLNEQVKRNPWRLPEDFRFPLTRAAALPLKSHFATLIPPAVFAAAALPGWSQLATGSGRECGHHIGLPRDNH